MGSGFQWYRTYERGYETSGSHLRFMLRRSSLVECVSVLPGNRCLQNVEFFFLRQYVQPCLLKNPKYTFYTIKSSLKLAYNSNTKNTSSIVYRLSNKHKIVTENMHDSTYNTARHIYRHGMCFRGIHFILISTAHALFLTCLPVSIYGT